MLYAVCDYKLNIVSVMNLNEYIDRLNHTSSPCEIVIGAI